MTGATRRNCPGDQGRAACRRPCLAGASIRDVATLVPSDPADRDEFLLRLASVVNVDRPPLPNPGPQPDWAALEPLERRERVDYQAEVAVRRLIDLGATTQDLYALARGVTALALMEALSSLDPEGEGELAGEFYSLFDEMRRTAEA